jgi:hypothetical protein
MLSRVAGNGKWRFFWTLVQLQIGMCVGALVCYLLGLLVPTSSSLGSVYYRGAYLYTLGDVLFLVAPVVLWMLFRRHGWRHSLEMAVAMVAPVAAIAVLGELTGYAYRSWLITAGYPAMSVGMFACMVYRPHVLNRASARSPRRLLGLPADDALRTESERRRLAM